jgi:microcin C transport system permease protein
MWQYILRRLLLIVPTLVGIVTVCFLLTQIIPGGPVEQAISQLRGGGAAGEAGGMGQANAKLNASGIEQQQIERFKKLYGFDKPIHVQYFNWMKRLFTFDFGESFFYNKKITELILEKLPVSATLGVISMFLTYLISIPLGIAKAVKQGTAFDTVSGVLVLVSYSIPPLVAGIILLVLFGGGSFFAWFPLRGLTSDNFAQLTLGGQILDYLWHMVLPVTAYSIGGFAWLTLFTRNLFLDEISAQYVTTARAKGLNEKVILWKHIFRNAMIMVISGIPSALVFMFFGGSLFVETIFSLDGLGLLSYESVMRRDYAFVLSNIYIFSLIGLLMRIVSDIVLSLVDPRITFAKMRE